MATKHPPTLPQTEEQTALIASIEDGSAFDSCFNSSDPIKAKGELKTLAEEAGMLRGTFNEYEKSYKKKRDKAFAQDAFVSLDTDLMGTDLYKALFAYNDPNSRAAKFAHIAKEFDEQIKIFDGVPHVFVDGQWSPEQIHVEYALTKKYPNLTQRDEREIFHKMTVLNDGGKPRSIDRNHIYFRNGAFDLQAKKFRETRIDEDVFVRLDCDYIESAPESDAFVDAFIARLARTDEEIPMLWEMIGYVLSPGNPLEVSFMLYGASNTGKSVLVKMLSRLVGGNNVTAAVLANLDQERTIAGIYGKHLVVIDESEGHITDLAKAQFKTLVAGGTMAGRFLYGEQFTFSFDGKIIMNANNLPRLYDATEAMQRRIVLIPCSVTPIKIEDRDTAQDGRTLVEKLVEHAPYIVKKALSHYHELRKRNKFISTELSEKAQHEGVLKSEPWIAFFDDLTEKNLEGEDKRDVYNRFLAWLADNGHKGISQSRFTERLDKFFVYKIGRGRTYYEGTNTRKAIFRNVVRIQGVNPEEDKEDHIDGKGEDFPF